MVWWWWPWMISMIIHGEHLWLTALYITCTVNHPSDIITLRLNDAERLARPRQDPDISPGVCDRLCPRVSITLTFTCPRAFEFLQTISTYLTDKVKINRHI
jgi:hypothetical protein